MIDIKPSKRVDIMPKVRFCTADEVPKLMSACEPDFRQLVKGAFTERLSLWRTDSHYGG
jgi:hypothetical protein